MQLTFIATPNKLYRYCWGNNEKRLTMKGRTCKVLARGKLNSCLIEFTDNRQREVVSRNSLRRINTIEEED